MRGRFILNIIQTNLQQKWNAFPTQLEFLHVLHFRGLSYFKEQKKLYVSLAAGDVGERRVLEYLEVYGGRGWVVLRNVWLSDFGNFECDVILLTGHCVYLFEVKNYTGLFEYDQGKCAFEEIETSLHPIEQCRRNVVNMRNILKNFFPNLPVKAAVLFAGDDNDVQIYSAVDDIDIRNRTQLKRFVQAILAEERNSQPHYIPFEKIVAVLERFEIANPYMPPPLAAEELKHVKGGMYCASCQSFEVQISKSKVVCSCGFIESRDRAMVRTIHEYGRLTYGQPLIRKKLIDFFGRQTSLTYLKTILGNHFQAVYKSGHSYYLNSPDK